MAEETYKQALTTMHTCGRELLSKIFQGRKMGMYIRHQYNVTSTLPVLRHGTTLINYEIDLIDDFLIVLKIF
jgi:hypothetical protein